MKVGTRKVQNLLRAKKYEIGSGRKSTKFAPGKKVRNWLWAKVQNLLRAKGTKFGPAKKVESTKVGPGKNFKHHTILL